MEKWNNLFEETTFWDFGDARLNQRLEILLNSLSNHPTESIPDACNSWAETKAAYQFLNNDRINIDSLIQGTLLATIDRIQMEDVILVAKNTSGLDFTSRKATSGLGMLDNDFTRGIKIHDGLAISTHGKSIGFGS